MLESHFLFLCTVDPLHNGHERGCCEEVTFSRGLTVFGGKIEKEFDIRSMSLKASSHALVEILFQVQQLACIACTKNKWKQERMGARENGCTGGRHMSALIPSPRYAGYLTTQMLP